jgi:hypothetical protein
MAKLPIIGKFQHAKEELEAAERDYERAAKKNGRHRKACEAEMAAFGAEKVAALDLELRQFVDAFSQLRNAELSDVVINDVSPVDDITMAPLQKLDFDEWDAVKLAAGLAPVVSAAAGSGAVAGAAVWTAGAVGAAASTGTAISSLSGAAATNATLAWLGGGSVAAGGGGVAVGAAVLTGAVAAPVILVGGIFVNRKGNQALAQAEAQSLEVQEFVAKLEAANKILDRTADLSRGLAEILERLRLLLAPRIADLQSWVAREKNFNRYSQKRQLAVAATAALAGVTAAVATTSPSTRNGNPSRKARSVLKSAETFVGQFEV